MNMHYIYIGDFAVGEIEGFVGFAVYEETIDIIGNFSQK
jgi:hypothetical protein